MSLLADSAVFCNLFYHRLGAHTDAGGAGISRACDGEYAESSYPR